MKINEKIKYFRDVYLDMNQVQFAKEINVTRQTVIKWENGDMKPSLQNIKYIADHFGIYADYFIDEDCELLLSPRGINDDGYKIVESLIKYFETTNEI